MSKFVELGQQIVFELDNLDHKLTELVIIKNDLEEEDAAALLREAKKSLSDVADTIWGLYREQQEVDNLL